MCGLVLANRPNARAHLRRRFGVVAAILWQTFDRRFALITNLASVDPGRPIPDRVGWPNFAQKKKFYDLCTKLTHAAF